MTLVAQSGVHPPRWEIAMQLLLAKTKGATTVDSNRYVVLFEGDFNHTKGHFFGGVLFRSIRAKPENHHGSG